MIRWYDYADRDVLWTVHVTTPNGDTFDEPVEAADSDDAATYVTELYSRLTGEDFDTVATWVDPAQRLRRSA